MLSIATSEADWHAFVLVLAVQPDEKVFEGHHDHALTSDLEKDADMDVKQQ